MKHLFFGGVHPKYNKEMSMCSTMFKTITPKVVVLPMLQHVGVPCTPLVQVGDKVKRGQKIGDGEGMCVPVHASVSGTVIAVEPRPHTNGKMIMAVVIENDFQDTPVEIHPCTDPLEELDDEVILNAIREAGMVGMGGAAFPGNIKAIASMGKINYMIANACECEPYITADDALLRTSPRQVLEGMRIMKKVLKPDHAVLAIEDNKQEALEILRPIMSEYPDIEVYVLPTRYPQGSEKQLIQAITGRQVPSGKLPVSVGCAVFNEASFAGMYRAVRLGYPITQRIVTVSGEAINEPQNFIVRIGTPFRDLIVPWVCSLCSCIGMPSATMKRNWPVCTCLTAWNAAAVPIPVPVNFPWWNSSARVRLCSERQPKRKQRRKSDEFNSCFFSSYS